MLDMRTLIQEDFHIPSGKVEISIPEDAERKRGEEDVSRSPSSPYTALPKCCCGLVALLTTRQSFLRSDVGRG